MKIVLIIVLTALALVAAGVGFFVATFDANRFKPQLSEALEKATGSSVRIGSLHLGWAGGISVQINQLALTAAGAPADSAAAATLERIHARLKLAPLLRKKIEVVSLSFISPRVTIVKDEAGVVRLEGLGPRGSPQPGPEAPSPASPRVLPAFSIGKIQIENGELNYADLSSPKNPRKISLKNLDASLENAALSRPMDFKAKFSLLSAAQNVSLKGRLKADSFSGPFTIENFSIQNDLSTIRLAEFSQSVPAVKGLDLSESLKGKLSMELPRWVVGAEGEQSLKASLSDGRFKLRALRSAFEHVTLTAGIQKNTAQLKDFSADFAGGTLTADAVSTHYASASADTTLSLQARGLKLGEIIPAPKAGRPQLEGNLAMDFEGAAKGLSWPSLSHTLNGRGRASLTEGVILNLNVLKKILDLLSKIQGVSEALNNFLPQGYRESLAKPHTVLEPMEVRVNVVNGRLVFNELRVTSTGFQIVGAGQLGLDGAVNVQATLFLDPVISEILVSNISNMQYVMNPQGLVAIPVRLRGTIQNLAVEPDMDFIFQKVLFQKGQELVERALEKALSKGGDSAQGAAEQGGSAYQKILGQFLQ